MDQITAVFVIIAHFTVMGYGGDALPEGKRWAFTTLADCNKAIPAVRLSFRNMPVAPDRITCEKMELRR